MRLDRFRRRPAHPPPSPQPSSPARPPPSPAPSFFSSPSRWPASERHRSSPAAENANMYRSHANGLKPAMSRLDYIRDLQTRMHQMESVPTKSFTHTFAGEFEVLLAEEREATRKAHEFDTSTRIENTYRNRYTNILANEPTRVRLRTVAPGENDYINANRVSGPDVHPGYIATQAPLASTKAHFWQMVYESASSVIVMLTREHEERCEFSKSEQYWPLGSENILFNDYLVNGIDVRVDEQRGVVERRFRVGRVVDRRRSAADDANVLESGVSTTTASMTSATTAAGENAMWLTPARSHNHSNGNNRDEQHSECDTESLLDHLELVGHVLEVTQLQYLDWPDQGVPTSPHTILDMCHRVDALMEEQRAKTGRMGPPVVHCSAGVGRTGTFIAIDWTLRRLWDVFAAADGSSEVPVSVDEIRELVRTLKRERSRMVQTPQQYRFIYQAVLEGMLRWERGQNLFCVTAS